MGPILMALLSILISLLAYILIKAYRINQHWAERGIPHVKPVLFFGNSFRLLLMKQNVADYHEEICNRFPNEPVIGFYDFSKPLLIVKDVDLLEKIMIKDFLHFTDRGLEIDEETNPLDVNLFTMSGTRWRALRIKLAPIFTAGKLRFMYGPMNDCGNNLVSLLETNEDNTDVDIKEVLGRFSMDVIGSCAFGIDARNLEDGDNEFRRMGKKQFQMDFIQFLKFIMITNFPNLVKRLKIKLNRPDVSKYFCDLIKKTLEHRKNNKIHRNDFIQLMLQLQEKGYVEIQTKDASDDYLEIDTSNYKTETFEISDNMILGQAFAFLVSGFETIAIALTYCLYELAKHPKIMAKVRDEIKQHAKDDESLTYDAVRDMTYLEQCVKEGQRKYPQVPFLFRICTKEYALPNGFIIPKGQTLMVPVKAVHYNPEIYPEPNEFQPERFDPDRVIPSCAFLPFGNGPRMCIAMRFVMMEMKYALAKLLLNYEFKVSPKTVEPLTFDPKSFVLMPKQNVYLTVSKIRR
ncbi:hypothetical protein O3M35_012512 [Rhynocoris fuscipes]|uniref:Cytochrome P450 n=1 Tax=Rhynocoris fuscipes TaxID=488301 RepID=A0AAW1CU84_9HEMI